MGNFQSHWVEHQDVQITEFYYNMLVTSKQNDSTPGLVNANVAVVPGKTYVYSIIAQGVVDVEGTNDFSVFPFIRDSDTLDIVYGPDNKDNMIAFTGHDISDIEWPLQIIFKIPENVYNLDLFLLFKDQEIGSQFLLEAISFDLVDFDIEDEIDESPEYFTRNGQLISTEFGTWLANQDVSHNYINDALKVIAGQNTSTPGVRHRDLTVIPGEKYMFKFVGRKTDNSFNVFPYINDAFTGLSVFSPYDNSNVVTATDTRFGVSMTSIEVVLTIPQNVTKVQVYVLFEHQSKNDTFYLHDFDFHMRSDITFTLDDISSDTHNSNLLAYSDKSVFEGSNVNICTSVKTAHIDENLKFIKYALLDISKNVVKVTNSPNIIFQDYKDDGVNLGCDWTVTHSMETHGIVPGMYFICVMYSDHVTFLPLIIKNKNNVSKLLILSNINTWTAYESWAGYNDDVISLHRWTSDISSDYKDVSHNVALQVTMERPFTNASEEILKYLENDVRTFHIHTHQVYNELWMYKFLYDNNIDFDIINDHDLHHTYFGGYEMFMIHGHAQYWTEQSIKNVSTMGRNGTDLAYFGGGAFHYKVTYDDDNIVIDKGASDALWSNNTFDAPYLHPIDMFGLSFNPSKYVDTSANYYTKDSEHFMLKGSDYTFGHATLGTLKNDKVSGWLVDDTRHTTDKSNVIGGAIDGGEMVYLNKDTYRSFSCGTLLWNSTLFTNHSTSNITLNVIKEFVSGSTRPLRKSPIDVIASAQIFPRDLSNNIVSFDYLGETISSIKRNLSDNYYFEVSGNKIATFNGRDFELKYYCFNKPSEHLLNGIAYPMSVYLIHKCLLTDTYVTVCVFISDGVTGSFDQSIDSDVSVNSFSLDVNKNSETIHIYPGTIDNDMYTGSCTWIVFDKHITSSQISKWSSYKGKPNDIVTYNSLQEIMTYGN